MEEKQEMVIPRWFAIIAAGVLTLAIPWAGWVTMALARISVQIESQAQLRVRVDQLETRFTDHLTDPNIHHAKLTSLEARIRILENKSN